jgi:AraC-like DNA-binding protein
VHFSREFRQSLDETPRQYCLTRPIERAAELFHNTYHPDVDICCTVELRSRAAHGELRPRVRHVPIVHFRSSEDARVGVEGGLATEMRVQHA